MAVASLRSSSRAQPRAGRKEGTRATGGGGEQPPSDSDGDSDDSRMDPSVTQSILAQRSRFGPLQVYLLLTLMALMFALSSLLMPGSAVSSYLPRSVGGRFKAKVREVPSTTSLQAAAAKAAAAEATATAQAAVDAAGVKPPPDPTTTTNSSSSSSTAAAAPLSPDDAARLAQLRDDAELPLVWIDVSIKGKPAGRIHFVLFVKDAPRAAENFRQLITGERGIVPEGRQGAGQPYHLKGKPFYRIITNYIDQSGANTESVFGGSFKDDPGGLKLKHDRKGLLSMANTGPNENTSHWSILCAPAGHLDGKYVVFGEAVDGMEVIDVINALAKDKPDHTATAQDGAVIADCGQIRKGSHQPNLEQN